MARSKPVSLVPMLSRRALMAGMAAFSATPWRLARAASPMLSLTTGMREPWTTEDRTGFTDLVVAEAFRRLGIAVEVGVNLAASRAIRLADDGVDDGLTARVGGLDRDYPNLIAVPEPIFHNDFVACSLDQDFTAKGWDSLAPYSVSYIIGWQVFEHNLTKTRELTLAKDSAQLFALLKTGRADVILHERWQARWHARQHGIALRVHEPPLARVPMFMYLHRRHADLAPKVAAQLVAMRADGAYQRLAEKAFAGLGGEVHMR